MSLSLNQTETSRARRSYSYLARPGGRPTRGTERCAEVRAGDARLSTVSRIGVSTALPPACKTETNRLTTSVALVHGWTRRHRYCGCHHRYCRRRGVGRGMRGSVGRRGIGPAVAAIAAAIPVTAYRAVLGATRSAMAFSWCSALAIWSSTFLNSVLPAQERSSPV